jgi:hypothetical protein
MTPLIYFEVSSYSQLCDIAYFQVMGLWHDGHFIECFPPWILEIFQDTQITFLGGWVNNCPKFDGDPSLDITHVVNFLKYVLEIDVTHQDVIIIFFFLSMETRQKDWVEHTLHSKSISSLEIFIEKFLKRWAPITQIYEDTFHNLTVALQREGLCSIPVEEDEESIDEQEVEDNIHEEGYQSLEEENNYLMILLKTTKT